MMSNLQPPEWLTTIGAGVDDTFRRMHEGVAELGRQFREMLAALQPPEWLSKLGGAVVGAAGSGRGGAGGGRRGRREDAGALPVELGWRKAHWQSGGRAAWRG